MWNKLSLCTEIERKLSKSSGPCSGTCMQILQIFINTVAVRCLLAMHLWGYKLPCIGMHLHMGQCVCACVRAGVCVCAPSNTWSCMLIWLLYIYWLRYHTDVCICRALNCCSKQPSFRHPPDRSLAYVSTWEWLKGTWQQLNCTLGINEKR